MSIVPKIYVHNYQKYHVVFNGNMD